MQAAYRSRVIVEPRFGAIRALVVLIAGLAALVGVAAVDIVGNGVVLHGGERSVLSRN